MHAWVQVLWSILFCYTSQKRSPSQASQLQYVWGTQSWKMCHIEFKYFSAYKLDVMHTKLAFILTLGSICTPGKNQLPSSAISQSLIDLWRTNCPPMGQMIALCKEPLPKEKTQSTVCTVYNPSLSDRSVRETLPNPMLLTLSHQQNGENKRRNMTALLREHRLCHEMEMRHLLRSLGIGCKGKRNSIKGTYLSS